MASILWSNVKNWNELINNSVLWLEGYIKGLHPISNYELNEIMNNDNDNDNDNNKLWLNFIIWISLKIDIFTVDSQPGICDDQYKSPPSTYINNYNEKHDTTFTNIKTKEEQRPYIAGLVPITILDKLIKIFRNDDQLVLFVCFPHASEMVIYGGIGSWDNNDKFNLTRILFDNHIIDNTTNVYKNKCKKALNIPINFKYQEMQNFIDNEICYITITTTQYCSTTKFINKIKNIFENII